MKKYSITEEIQKLKPNEAKVYCYLYADSGFELGFGKAGKYSGHSHLYFCDILFSPKPILTCDADGKSISGNLIVVPPQTYLGEVATGDFFFIKFCPSKDKVVLPDKINTIARMGEINSFSKQANIECSWYKDHLSKASFFKLDLTSTDLKISLGNHNSFLIS